MNEITERGYKGPLVFYKNLKYGYFNVTYGSAEEFYQVFGGDGDRVVVGTCDVDVEFEADTREADTRETEIEALEKQLEKVREKMALQLANIEDRISKLRALLHRTEGEAT